MSTAPSWHVEHMMEVGGADNGICWCLPLSSADDMMTCKHTLVVFFWWFVQVIEPLVEQMRPYLPADVQQQQQQHVADDHHHPCHEQHLQEGSQLLQPHAQDRQQVQQNQDSQQQQPDFLSEKLTMLLLLQEPSAWGDAAAWADPQQQKQWQQLLDASAVSIVEGEVQYLRQQLMHIEDVLHEGREAAAAVASDGGVSDGADVGAAGGAPACSSCPFQLDCTIKGCIKGELTAAAPSLRSHKAAAAGRQPGREEMAGGSSGGGCCGGGSQGAGVSHACCS
jgi:hypothetical protein